VKTLFVLLFVSLSGIVLSWIIHSSAQEIVHENVLRIESLRLQIEEMESRVTDSPRLEKDPLVNRPSDDLLAELAALRQESQELEQATRELEREPLEEPSSDAFSILPELDADDLYSIADHFPAMDLITELEGAALKKSEMRHITSAVRRYAREHEGNYPSELEQTVPYLWDNRRIPDFSLYELVFQGANEEVKGIPPSAVALIKEKEAWVSPQGRRSRVYGMLGGDIEVVETDDDFVAWETQHVVPSSR
jgi:hypothetical protein